MRIEPQRGKPENTPGPVTFLALPDADRLKDVLRLVVGGDMRDGAKAQ
jgi:hypothetical protein